MLLTALDQRVWDPFASVSKLRDEMNQLFGERTAAYPAINLWTHETGAVVTAEIPGVETGDIDITVEGDRMVIKGTRAQHSETPDRAESAAEPFQRSLKLPFRVDADQIEAQHARGVLTVKLPRAKESLAKKIEIKTI